MGTEALLKKTCEARWPVIIIANQSGVSRGYFNWNGYEIVTEKVLHLLGDLGPVAAIYANGYGPDAPKNSWRKPNPAMLYTAESDLKLDLKHSIMVGNRLSDLKAAAGVKLAAHVRTGHGKKEYEKMMKWRKELKGSKKSDLIELLELETLENFPMQYLTSNK